MSEWKEYNLDDLIKTKNQGVNTTTEKVSYVNSGIKVIRAKNIRDYKIDFDDIVYIDESTYDRVRENVKPKKGDILFTNIGSQLGSAALINYSDKFIIAWNALRIVVDETKADACFLVYVFNSPSYKSLIRGLDSSSTMPFVSGKVLGQLKFNLPDILTQKKISEILSSLDDKIELNNKINQELESLAYLLFKKLCNNQEDLNNNKSIKLKELLVIKNGYAFKGMDFITSGIPVIKIKNVKAGLINFKNLSFVSSEVAAKAKKHKINKYDLLITMSGNRIDGSIDSWVGKVGMFPKEGNFLLNQRVSILEVKDEMHKFFLLQLLSSEDFQNYFISNATSSGGQANISPDLIYNTEIVLPSIEILNKFYESSKIIHSIIFNNMAENEKLVELRETLLPKLISGELQINNN
jgi:type I restriction enzyme S subunit